MSARECERDGVGRRADTSHLDERALATSWPTASEARITADAPSLTGEQSRRRSGSATLARREHLLDRDARMDLRARVEQAVLVVLHGDARRSLRASCRAGACARAPSSRRAREM